MNKDRFDDFARQLGSGKVSRRKVIKLLAAGVVGGVAAGRGTVDALASGGNSACAHYCTAVFGGDTAAQAQCASDGAHGIGLCFTCGPNRSDGDDPVPPPWLSCQRDVNGYCSSYGQVYCSCFIGTTSITMADGTSRPIERVQIGDLVIGSDGQVNRVVEIEQPLLGTRDLYALNGGEFFVTAEHPFMTEDGWKSIEPARLAAEGSTLSVNRLSVGDGLVRLTGVAMAVGAGGPVSGQGTDVRTDTVSLDSLVGRSEDPMTQLYNLRLDGNHTYFANGLLVHNK